MIIKIYGYLKLEAVMWLMAISRLVPGFLGCFLRRVLIRNCESGVMIWDGVIIEYVDRLTIGENTSINRGCILNCGGGVDIGSNVLIGPRVLIYSQNHKYEDRNVLIRKQGYVKKNVVIEDDVWISSDAKIMPGILIGKGSVIAAGAVVTKSTESYGVYAGVPAIKIGERTE